MNDTIQFQHLLTSRWNSVGLNTGDCVLLHSNVKPVVRESIRGGVGN
jgi:hypothetical protein